MTGYAYPPSLIPYTKYTMPKNILDKAIEAVPRFGDRISLFTKKLRLAQYADSTIYSYRLKISQAVLYLEKLPDKFTQEDVDDYLSMLLERNRYGQSHFKHTVFGLKDYYKYMGLKESVLNDVLNNCDSSLFRRPKELNIRWDAIVLITLAFKDFGMTSFEEVLGVWVEVVVDDVFVDGLEGVFWTIEVIEIAVMLVLDKVFCHGL